MLLIHAALALTLIGGAPQLRAAASPGQPALTAPAAPVRICASTSHTGTFRIMAITADSTDSKVGMILLENVGGCLEASMITDVGGPAIIDHLTIAGDTITGSIRMTTGIGKVSLHISDSGIDGTIIEGRHFWKVAGKRTN